MSRRVPFMLLLFAVSIFAVGAVAVAQRPPATQPAPAGGAESSAEPADELVVIEREPMRLIDPEAFQLPLQLEPIREAYVTVVQPGVVRAVLAKPGAKAAAQTEVARLDDTEQKLELARAQALHEAAAAELKRAQAAGGDPSGPQIADARLRAAKAEVDLAQLALDRLSVRTPFVADLVEVTAVEGAYVRPGDPLCRIGDTSQLKVRMPVDRKQVSPGNKIELKIEDQTLEGTVDQVLPLDARFDPLRKLVDSAATAIVLVDNPLGNLKIGQTVYSPIIPRQPVAEIPTSAVGNLEGGRRKVQAVRGGTVKDVEVQLLGQVGATRVYVSGAFAPGDEVVVSTSKELADGTVIRPGEIVVDSTKPTGTAPGGGGARPPAPSTTRRPSL